MSLENKVGKIRERYQHFISPRTIINRNYSTCTISYVFGVHSYYYMLDYATVGSFTVRKAWVGGESSLVVKGSLNPTLTVPCHAS